MGTAEDNTTFPVLGTAREPLRQKGHTRFPVPGSLHTFPEPGATR